jgi:precorrin-6B methylase 2
VTRRLAVEQAAELIVDGKGVFKPTQTSRILATEALKYALPASKILDLGCGSGVVGLELAHHLEGNGRFFFSDLSQGATDVTTKNLAKLGFAGEVRQGSIFEPWIGENFDLIVSDVSGVIPDIGQLLGWFKDIPNDSGPGGNVLLDAVIGQAKGFLAPHGVLLVPLISLSDEEASLERMRAEFGGISKLSETALPLGISGPEVERFAEEHPSIRIKSIFNVGYFFTSVYALKN